MKHFLLFFFFVSMSFASIAKISTVVGEASVLRGEQKIIANVGLDIYEKDVINTSSNSKLQLIFKDNTVITLGKNSALDVSEYLYDINTPKNSKANLNFFKGAFKAITGNIGKINKEKFKLRTKSSTIGIRGTVILANQTTIACLSGEISVDAQNQQVIVPQNQMTIIQDDGSLSKPVVYNQETLNNLSNQLEPENNNSSEKKEESNITTSTNNSTSDDTTDNQSETTKDSSLSNTGTSSENLETLDNQADTTENSSSSLSNKVDEVIEDSTKTEVEAKDETISFDLSGKALGAYMESQTSDARTNGFNYQDETDTDGTIGDFTAKRVDSKISFNETLTKILPNTENTTFSKELEKTFTLGTPKDGGYTGHSNITDNSNPISFTYTTNSGTINGNYNVQADNMGEVFAFYYDGDVFDVLQGQGEYNELIVFGKKGSVENEDKTKIYVYKDFASMSFKKNSSNHYTETKLDTSTVGFEYYNSHLKSLTHLNKSYYLNGAQEFIVGNNEKVKSYRNKYNFTYSSSTNLSSYITASNSAELNFLGSDIQALNYSLSNSETTNTYGNSTSSTTTTGQTNGISFLQKDKIVDAKISGSSTLKGYITADTYGTSSFDTHMRKASNNLSLNVNAQTGNITGSGSVDNKVGDVDNTVSMSFNGEVASNTSYYINDDIFGVMAKKGDSTYKAGNDEYDLDDNTGYLIAVPDGAIVKNEFKIFDTNDNPLTSDDDSSWGYWTAKFSDGSTSGSQFFVSPFATWVAGVETPTSVVDQVLNANSNTRYTFEGAVIGSVLNGNNGTLESIILDGSTTNKVTLNFDLGAGDNSLSSGVMNFSSKNTQWNMNINRSSEISNTGFKANLSGTDISGNLEGKFYGSDSIKSVGGSFNSSLTQNPGADDSVTHKAQGVFKAIKK
ncbi:FecR domain-containing protein [Arcobacter sp. YIC-464]|uniref:FecR domain-containing protein n=1 Tax=Arcobacter sp. YIC-464 TaxID=3376631 RepID=UPI003C17D3B0